MSMDIIFLINSNQKNIGYSRCPHNRQLRFGKKSIKRFNLKTKLPAQKKIKARLAGGGKGQVGRFGRIRMMFSFLSIIIFQNMARNETNFKKTPLGYGLILKLP